MKLSSSLREKKRYLKFKIESENNIDSKSIKKSILDVFKEFYGLKGLALAGIQFVKSGKGFGIIRVSKDYINNLKGILTLIDKVNNKDVRLSSMKVSGIIKKVI